ncbi:uncharacterized protein DC041_0004216 [Schistosoma bovis]|uniref:Myotubularin phosphatase domain-containing protein n=1 Tax=Schistosoma bovis TaxID=6184 RepID=A0A430QQM3_SCHBO|nr:uncharacterized protein DC041_0004216 [Schistosoma bovis]
MDNVPCCYCTYEVPFRGVSSEHPTGHLLTAVRNSGEKQLLGKPLDKIFRFGCFEVAHNKLTLYGILGLSNWEVLFVPCINLGQISKENINATRQLLSQTLHRTEPYFYQSWISNRPGSIGLGKIDYLIIQDRHDHLYKFDPINNIWLHSINGNGIKLKKFKKYWLNTTDNTTNNTTPPPIPTTTTTSTHHHHHNKLPHTPTRLLILTTDFEVFSFQLCYNQLKLSTISIITTKELNKLRKNIKNNINLFINLLTKRISYIRKSTGYLLANEYAIHHHHNNNNNNDLETLLIGQQDTTHHNLHKRSNVNIYETNWNDNKRDFPVKCTPVNSLTRLKTTWYHRLKGNYVIINNTDFAYCRTLPLEVPTLAFKMSVIIFRDYFEGHRFPMLSFYYSNSLVHNKNSYLYKHYPPYSLATNTTTTTTTNTTSPVSMSLVHRFGVWILRSGNLLTDINMNQLIDCNNYLSSSTRTTTTTSNHQKKLYLKHIKLSFSDHLNELFKDKNIVKSTESTLQEFYIPLYEDYSNDWCTPTPTPPPPTTTTDDCTFMTTSDHPTNNDNENMATSLEQNNFIPSSLITELYELNQHDDNNWLIPKHNHIKQSWLQLKNLIELPQIHTPNVEIFNEFTNTTTYNNNNNNNSMNDTTDYDSSVVGDHHSLINVATTTPTLNTNNHNNTSSSNDNLMFMNWDTLSTDSLSSEREKKYSDILFRSKSKQIDHSIIDKRLSTRSDWHKLSFTNLLKTDNSSNNHNHNHTNNKSNSTNNLRNSIGQSFSKNYSHFYLLNKKKLDHFAFQCSPHRSDWYDYLLSTNWLNLLLFTLKQATQLSQLIYQYSMKPINGYDGTIILLSGPDSGRNWQPILMSLVQIMLSAENRTILGFEDLIEQEWIRYGYPFVPDPTDWHDDSVSCDYDDGACFALFIDCVHQLLVQFPTEFAFTEDYLVLLLDSALSRGGGTPPFTIEFSCSCEATRHVKTKSMTQEQIIEKSNYFYNIRAWRSFHNWNDILTDHGYQLLFNWLYFWQYNSDPVNNRSDYTKLIQTINKSKQILIPILSPLYYPHFWIHAWYRWNRSIRLTNGGGYAFNAAYYRNLLGSTLLNNNNNNNQNSFQLPRTNTTPYTGWLTDESIRNALNHIGYSISFDYFYKNLYEIANLWDNNEDFNTS